MKSPIRTRLAILADDFTGANDTAVQFVKKGFSTGVSLDTSLTPAPLQSFDVLAIDTETRFDSGEDAYRKVLQTTGRLTDYGVYQVYKKIDSTLRGNPGGEIAAALDATAIQLAIVAPALPSHGRTTVAGRCLVNGIPLAETEFGRDPRTPVRDSFIAAIIAAQCDYPVATIDLQRVRSGPQALLAALSAVEGRGTPRIAVLDAETTRDLEIIARCAALLKEPPLLAGSSGLADHLWPGELPATAARTATALRAAPKSLSGVGILIVVGSVSQTACSQVDHALAARPDLCELRLAPDAAADDPRRESRRLLRLYRDARRSGAVCILRTTRSADDTRLCANSIALCIGRLVADICITDPPKGMMLSGGDTAVKTAAALGCSGFAVSAEVLPGIPCGYFMIDSETHPQAADVQQIAIVTKAGGFGGPDAILRIIQHLEEMAT